MSLFPALSFATPQAFTHTSSEEEMEATSPLTLDSVQTLKSLDKTRYNISRVVSLVPFTFGMGHAVQGRWLDKGWVFTGGEILLSTGFVVSLGFYAVSASLFSLHRANRYWGTPTLSFLLVYLGLKTYSAIDIWKAPGYKIEKSSYQSPYYLSGITSIFPGFGIGHAVQGRWLDKGWIFTGGELLSVGGMLTAPIIAFVDFEALSVVLLALSVTAFIVLKRLEVNDVWKADSQYKIGKSPRLDLQPVFSMNALKGNDFGLSLKYSF